MAERTMGNSPGLIFAPFRLDVRNEQLWRGEEVIRLTRKALTVLQYLVEHPGQLVTKDALLDIAWSHAYVSETAISVCLREIRQALGDNRRAPQFIETVYGRGYRFIAAVTTVDSPLQAREVTPYVHLPFFPSQPEAPFSAPSPVSLVAREAELTQLHHGFAKVLRGERQVVFVTGEVGIGKTTLVEAFVQGIGAGGPLWIGHGQCIEQYGVGEAYLPVLEALGRLCRAPTGQRLIALLARHAPSWLRQMPALLSDAEYEAIQRREPGATQERMLRELAEAVETLTAEQPLVLVFEDLHWSDQATLAWLALVARRREAARLLILGTYRPEDVRGHAPPLRTIKQELQRHGQCDELRLTCLSATAVAAYLARRFEGQPLPGRLARFIHQRTDGNPFFMVAMIDAMIQQGVLSVVGGQWTLHGRLTDRVVGIPESLRQLIEQQLEQLTPEDCTLLEAASVTGVEFSAAAVAAGAVTAEADVEERCAALARQGQFVKTHGSVEWPDGTVAARYRFIHALYQEVFYDRVPAGRRIQLHLQIGVRQEAGYGERGREIATELAVHFEAGRDVHRALRYRWQAGRNAMQQCAHHEAIIHLTKGLELLQALPDTLDRTQQELKLQAILGTPLIATKGWAAPEVQQAYTRAYTLWRQMDETPQFCWLLSGLSAFHSVRAEWHRAQELAEQLLTLAQGIDNSTVLIYAHLGLGGILHFRGDFATAREHVEYGLALRGQHPRHPSTPYAMHDPEVVGLCHTASALWHLGYPDQAQRRLQEALSRAQELAQPFTQLQALALATMHFPACLEAQRAHEQLDALVTLATEQEFPFLVAGGTICRGLLLIHQGQRGKGRRQLHQGLEAYRTAGVVAGQPCILASLAKAYGHDDQINAGLALLDDAMTLVETTDERIGEAELHRIRGELLLAQGAKRSQAVGTRPEGEAEASLHLALAVARRQLAKSLELRAAVSLSRLWQQRGRRAEARQLLAEVYDWFTEGFETADLQEAKALLEELDA